jgi:catechol 2,3-dioxygenase-like lactoylglutathione lyase family enzyme
MVSSTTAARRFSTHEVGFDVDTSTTKRTFGFRAFPHPDDDVMTAPSPVDRFVLVIKTARFAASLEFYRDLVGLQVVEEWTDAGHGAVLSAGGVAEVELIDLPDIETAEARDDVFLGLQVPDIDEMHQRARAAGVEIVREPAERPWGGRGFVVRDPNGVAVNVYTAYR